MELTNNEGEFLKANLLKDTQDYGVILSYGRTTFEFADFTSRLVKEKVLDVINEVEKNLNCRIFQLTPLGCEALMQFLGGRLYREHQVIESIGTICKPIILPTWRGLIVGKTSNCHVQVTSARADVILPFARDLLFREIPVVVQPGLKCEYPIRLTLIRN